jgi:RsiW-degrading membrane proteinase PrsW (M82 family)
MELRRRSFATTAAAAPVRNRTLTAIILRQQDDFAMFGPAFLVLVLWPILLPPLAFWMWVQREHRRTWDPRPYMKYFLSGALICIPVVLAEILLSKYVTESKGSIIQMISYALFVAAIPEEGARAILLYYFVKRSRAAEPLWIVSCALALSMGQAAVENGLLALSNPDELKRMATLLIRGVVCIPTMGAYGLALGISTAWVVFARHPLREGILKGFLLATIGHAIYDSGVVLSNNLLRDPYSSYVAILVASIAIIAAFLPVRGRYIIMSRA